MLKKEWIGWAFERGCSERWPFNWLTVHNGKSMFWTKFWEAADTSIKSPSWKVGDWGTRGNFFWRVKLVLNGLLRGTDPTSMNWDLNLRAIPTINERNPVHFFNSRRELPLNTVLLSPFKGIWIEDHQFLKKNRRVTYPKWSSNFWCNYFVLPSENSEDVILWPQFDLRKQASLKTSSTVSLRMLHLYWLTLQNGNSMFWTKFWGSWDRLI